MPHAALHDKVLRSLEIPAQGQIDWWDTSFKGFGLRVSQGGTKTFILNIDKSRRTIGRYPIISLAEARTEARRLLAERTLGKVRPQAIAFPKAVELFLEEKRKSRRPRTADDYEYYLNRFFSFKGQLTDATHAEVSRRLERIKKPSLYNHTLANARGFFNWCVKRRYIDDNPVRGLSPHRNKSRSRVLSDYELKCIWRACEQTGEQSSDYRTGNSCRAELPPRLPAHFATIVKLLILTGQRRGEIAALQTSWIDLNDKSCSLPASATKNGRTHLFPLSSATCSLLAPSIISKSEPTSGVNHPALLFPARGKTSAPFNGWSKSKAALDELSGVYDWTLHDLRRTFATRCAEMGTAPHVIEALLNHKSGTVSGVAAVYNKYAYLPEMREAQERYEQHLSKILELG